MTYLFIFWICCPLLSLAQSNYKLPVYMLLDSSMVAYIKQVVKEKVVDVSLKKRKIDKQARKKGVIAMDLFGLKLQRTCGECPGFDTSSITSMLSYKFKIFTSNAEYKPSKYGTTNRAIGDGSLKYDKIRKEKIFNDLIFVYSYDCFYKEINLITSKIYCSDWSLNPLYVPSGEYNYISTIKCYKGLLDFKPMVLTHKDDVTLDIYCNNHNLKVYEMLKKYEIDFVISLPYRYELYYSSKNKRTYLIKMALFKTNGECNDPLPITEVTEYLKK